MAIIKLLSENDSELDTEGGNPLLAESSTYANAVYGDVVYQITINSEVSPRLILAGRINNSGSTSLATSGNLIKYSSSNLSLAINTSVTGKLFIGGVSNQNVFVNTNFTGAKRAYASTTTNNLITCISTGGIKISGLSTTNLNINTNTQGTLRRLAVAATQLNTSTNCTVSLLISGGIQPQIIIGQQVTGGLKRFSTSSISPAQIEFIAAGYLGGAGSIPRVIIDLDTYLAIQANYNVTIVPIADFEVTIAINEDYTAII